MLKSILIKAQKASAGIEIALYSGVRLQFVAGSGKYNLLPSKPHAGYGFWKCHDRWSERTMTMTVTVTVTVTVTMKMRRSQIKLK